jgi:hypothetical protein
MTYHPTTTGSSCLLVLPFASGGCAAALTPERGAR